MYNINNENREVFKKSRNTNVIRGNDENSWMWNIVKLLRHIRSSGNWAYLDKEKVKKGILDESRKFWNQTNMEKIS